MNDIAIIRNTMKDNYFINLNGDQYNQPFYEDIYREITVNNILTKICNRLYCNLPLSYDDMLYIKPYIDNYNSENLIKYYFLDIIDDNKTIIKILEYHNKYTIRMKACSNSKSYLFV